MRARIVVLAVAVAALQAMPGSPARARGDAEPCRLDAPAARPLNPGREWRRLPPGPADGHTFATAVWSGRELLVWGGEAGSETQRRADGGAYNPRTAEWRSIPRAPIAARSEHVAVWTGEEMIVWGGVRADGAPADASAAYNPRDDRWRRLPRTPLRAAEFAVAVWTGDEMLVWGGTQGGGVRASKQGAAYNPTRNQWRKLPSGPLSPRRQAAAVWTGCEMVVWGGEQLLDDGAAFDPVRNRWRMLPSSPLATRDPNWEGDPEAAFAHISLPLHPNPVWTGREIVFWGLLKSNTQAPDTAPTVAYNPKRDAWRALPAPPIEFAPPWDGTGGDRAVAASGVVLAWTGNLDVAGPRLLALDPRSAKWSKLPSPGGPADYNLSLLAAGDYVIAWRHDTPVALRIA